MVAGSRGEVDRSGRGVSLCGARPGLLRIEQRLDLSLKLGQVLSDNVPDDVIVDDVVAVDQDVAETNDALVMADALQGARI